MVIDPAIETHFHTPDGLAGEIEQAGFTGVTVYGVEGPGWPLR